MPGPIRVANRADAGPLAASLARAFYDDPVISFLVPNEATRRRRAASCWSTLRAKALSPRQWTTVRLRHPVRRLQRLRSLQPALEACPRRFDLLAWRRYIQAWRS